MFDRSSWIAAGLALAIPTVLGAQSPIASLPTLPPDAILDTLYVADFTNDAIYALRDLDADGDANDPGEIQVFFDTTSPDPNLHLATPRYVAVGLDGAVYVGDSNKDFILRLEDIDLDGAANSAGEATVYFDAASSSIGLASISNIVFDQEGYLYLSDTGTSSTDRAVFRIRDDNGDGYCSEADGEVLVVFSFNTTTGLPIERPSGLAIDNDGSLIVSDYQSDFVYRFVDTLGLEDGDANDPGEQLLVFESIPGSVELNFAENIAFGPGDFGFSRPLYVNAGPTEDVVWRFFDSDGDGLWSNPTETTAFWDVSQADGIVPANARTLAVTPEGVVYALEAGSGAVEDQIVVLEDMNSDGDANDLGEARIFADNTNMSGVLFAQPQGMAFALDFGPGPEPEFVRSDCNVDGGTDIGDAVFTLNFLFSSSVTLLCEDACDSNDDGAIDISDAVFSLSFLFVAGSSSPPSPYPNCGLDVTMDLLSPCPALLTCP
ncbi:MAG: hypothetical protein KDC38_01095 [Planctomycetes bacterium]|nr:hypothetical protein [Planctomycetota bacterium]